MEPADSSSGGSTAPGGATTGRSSAFARVAQLLTQSSPLALFRVIQPHALLLIVHREEPLHDTKGEGPFGETRVLLASAEVWEHGRELLQPFTDTIAAGQTLLILIGCPQYTDVAQAIAKGVVALLPEEPRFDEITVALTAAFGLLEARARAESLGQWADQYRYELGELIEIARALTTERELDTLLGLILEKSRFITGADAGSIYVVEGDDPDPTRRKLRFKLTQNASMSFDSREFTISMSARSIAGCSALSRRMINIADVYDLPAGSEFSFDRRFDETTHYRTKSMLTTPLINKQGEVIGVLQVINKKRDSKALLLAAADVAEQAIPFDSHSEQLLSTLASHAGIALENALLYAEIRSLFEGFVKASVEAIEQRDPTTSGHSRRVADFTTKLAKAVERESTGPYRDVLWSVQDMRELEYASLLHDFGKIGVREQVLIKAKKLYPEQLASIRQRFDFVIRSLEASMLKQKLRALECDDGRGGLSEELTSLEEAFVRRRAGLEDAYRAIENANEPTVLKGGDFARIELISRETYLDLQGIAQPLLGSDEVRSLSIARGSLTSAEYDEICSHVVHTSNFLKAIPWGSALRRIPTIAGAHHERLNGTGYPLQLRAEEIPLQSKMMSVSDIFDALTASDRPYKRAVPLAKALDILAFEVKDQHIDGDLVRIFCDARVWE